MTKRRQQGKSLPWPACCLAAALCLGGWGALLGIAPGGAATTERIVSHPNSGLAISGFDPVAYFTDLTPRQGLADHELSFAGVVWRFRNEGNRAAFAADPEHFMPRFGGYDPLAVGRGVGAPGHPELWIVEEDRLYLFFNAAARDAFRRDPQLAIEAAERGWPQVLRSLVP